MGLYEDMGEIVKKELAGAKEAALRDWQLKQDKLRREEEKQDKLRLEEKQRQEEENERKERERIVKEQQEKEERIKRQKQEEIERKRAEDERKEQERFAAEKRAEEEQSKKFKESGESGKVEFTPLFLKEFVKELRRFNTDCENIAANAIEKQKNAISQKETTEKNLLQKQKNEISEFVSDKDRALKAYQSKLTQLNNKENLQQERDKLYAEYEEECKKILQSRKEKQEKDDRERSYEDKKIVENYLESKDNLQNEALAEKKSRENNFVQTKVFEPNAISEAYAEIYNADPIDGNYKVENPKISPDNIRIASLTYDLPDSGEHAKTLLETHYPMLWRHQKLYIPYCIDISNTNGIYFLQDKHNRDGVYKTMQSFILKLLLQVRPGLIKLTLYDGEGSGKNLIGLSHIDKRIKGENILTDSSELKRALEAAVSDMNTTIQKVLGSKYADKTLKEYNEIADKQAKPYHIICISDFPNGLSKEHLELIGKIVKSGKQAGVFIVMGLDTEYAPKNTYDNLDPSLLCSEMTAIKIDSSDSKLSLHLSDSYPEHDLLDEIQEHISAELKKLGKVEVKLDGRIGKDKLWQSDSRDGIKAPIGQLSITELKEFELSVEDGSSDTPHHCLIGGATGSGKTVLLHNIICWTAWNYSPDEVQFILLDYKEGTEFKVYENLPHAKVLSIHSEREYGISVLEYISAEIERRGKKFKEVNAQNIATYREKTGEKMPRFLVIIDEFQVLLSGDMKTSTFVSKALDDIGRRGRSFGINLILSSQSLSGVDISQTLSHLGLRIALKLNTEKDCDQFLGQGNHAPFKALQKKGEAIYNAKSGLSEGNVRFQVAYLSDKDLAAKISALQEKTLAEYGSDTPKSIVPRFLFDGEVNATFAEREYTPDYRKCKVYVGEPVALEAEHTSFSLLRQNESNVLVVGQDILATMSILSHSIRQILPQSTEECKVYVCNKVNMDNEYYGKLDSLPDEFGDKVNLLEDDHEIQRTIETVFDEVEKRKAENNKNRIILAFADIYNVRALRKSGYADSPLTQKLTGILKDGPGLGVHCIIHASSFDNLKNILDALSMLNEFNVRIELRGGDGYKIFQSNEVGIEKSTPDRENVANIQTAQINGIRKIKVYSF